MTPTEYKNLENEFETVRYPTKTYYFDIENNRIKGYTSGIRAMEQAVYKILMTERFKHIIYSFNYGFELEDLMNRLYPYIYAVLKQRIEEALLNDDRIKRVYNFSFTRNTKNRGLLVRFNVDTTEGEISIEKEVAV